MVSARQEKLLSRGWLPVRRPSLPLMVLLWISLLAISGVQAGVDYSRAGYRTSIILSDGSGNRWSMGASLTETQFSARAAWLRIRLNLRYCEPDGSLVWGDPYNPNSDAPESAPDDGSVSGRVIFQKRYVQSSMSLAPQREWADLRFDWRHQEGLDDFSCGLRLQPIKHFSWAATRSLTHPMPALTELFYYFDDDSGELEREGGLIGWHAPAWTTELTARAEWFGRLVATSSLKDSDFKPAEPQPDDPLFDGYTAVLDGKYNSGHVTGEYFFDSSHTLSLSYRRLEINSRCRAYENGRLFAYFGIVSLNADMWSLLFRQNDWRIGIAAGDADGDCSGTVQAWPFLDGLARFLGERRHFVGEGDIGFKHVSLHLPITNRTRLTVTGLLDYLRLKPDLRYATWRPVMFGFGVDDLKAERLDIERADLVRLGIRPSLSWKSLRLECELTQWVPIHTARLGDTDESSGSTSGTLTSDSPERAWGGFSAWIRLTSQL